MTKKNELRKKEAHKVCTKMGWNYYFLNHNLKLQIMDNLEFTKIINKIKPDINFKYTIFDDNIEHKNSNFFMRIKLKTSSEISLYQVYLSHVKIILIDITEEIKMKQKIIKSIILKRNKGLGSFFTWFKCMEFTVLRHKVKKLGRSILSR